MPALHRGQFRARVAASPADLDAAQTLRARAFGLAGPDADGFDARCDHLLIEDMADCAMVACCRVLPLASGAEIAQSYAAQFYDLTALAGFDAPMVELGRFCLHPERHDPNILRIAWAALTAYVDARATRLLFGCSSFRGTDAAPHAEAFALLGARHAGPARWRPRQKAARVVRFDGIAAPADAQKAWAGLPPLLRTYLAMGGWVSDHAVVDPALDTLHVFTGVELSRIPATRKRRLRMLAH